MVAVSFRLPNQPERMFSFLHIGDVHLDTSFLCRSRALRDKLQAAIRTAFSRAVDCAIAEEVDAVLIAGDLFDSDRLGYRTEAFLVEELQRLDARGVTTVYASGNHDPGGGQFAAVASGLTGRFHYVARNDVEVVEIVGRSGNIVGRVLAAGHATAHDAVNLAKRFPAATAHLPHVGLLHTMVAGARDVEGHERYVPCAVEDLRRPGYHYWALGHIHVRQQVCDQSHAYYCGNIQGRNPRECGPKGGLVVRVDGRSAPDVAFRDFAPIHWQRVEVNSLSDVATLRALAARVRESLESEGETGDGAPSLVPQHILRVALSGATPLFDRLSTEDQLEELEGELAHMLGVLDVEVRARGISRPLNLDEHRGQPHLLGEVLAMLEETAADPEALKTVIPDPLAGFAGRSESERIAYVRSLLDGLDREAAMRLLKIEQA